MKMSPAIVMCLCVAASTAARAATYYLDANGRTDAHCRAGTSPGSAWRSLRDQAHCVRPGDTVLLRAGTYRSESDMFWNDKGGIMLHGAQGQPITIKAADSGPEVRYPAKLVGEFYLTADHLVIEGIEFTRAPGDGTRNLLMVLGGQDIRIRNSSIHGLPGDYCAPPGGCAPTSLRDCVHLDGSNPEAGSVALEGNDIYNCAEDAIDNTGREGVTVSDNRIWQALRVQLKGGATRTRFIHNRLQNLTMGIVSGGMNCTADMQDYCGSPRQPGISPALRYQARDVLIADNEITELAVGPAINATGWADVDIHGNRIVRGNHANGSRGLMEVSRPDTGYGVSAYFDHASIDYCGQQPRPAQCVASGVTAKGRRYWRLASRTTNVSIHHNSLAGRSSLAAMFDGIGADSGICMFDNEYAGASFLLLDAERREPQQALPGCSTP